MYTHTHTLSLSALRTHKSIIAPYVCWFGATPRARIRSKTSGAVHHDPSPAWVAVAAAAAGVAAAAAAAAAVPTLPPAARRARSSRLRAIRTL